MEYRSCIEMTLATLLSRCDYIEQMGTGIERMKDAAREAEVAEPEFEFSGFFKVTFKRNATEISIDRQSAVNRPQSAMTADREQEIKEFKDAPVWRQHSILIS